MWRAIIAAIAVVLAAVSPASAHGGGGFVYVPIFIYNAPPQVPDAKTGGYSHIHRIAIITAIGQTLTLGQAGWLADHSTVDISDMKLDDKVDAAIRRYLPAQFSVVDVAYDRAKLAAIDNGFLDTSTKDFQDYLTSLSAPDVDAFIVVRPDGEKGAPTPGFSLDEDDYSAVPILRANFEIDVVDAKSGQIIAHALSRLQAVAGTIPNFAAIYAPEDLKIEPNQTPTDAQRAALKPRFEKLLTASLAQTLHVLNFSDRATDLRAMAPVPDTLRPKVSRIAVVSTVGDNMTLELHGAGFVHEVNKVPVADWNLDQEIESKVAASLDKRFTVVPANVDRTKAGRIFVVQDGFHNSKLNAPAGALLKAPAGIDAYLVVVKSLNLENSATAQYGIGAPGLYMHHASPFGAPDVTQLYVRYAMVLIDAQTLKPLAYYPGVTTPDEPSWQPVLTVDNSEWPDKYVFTQDQITALHGHLSDVFTDSIPETVMEMHLTSTMPADEIPQAIAQAAINATGSTTTTAAPSTP